MKRKNLVRSLVVLSIIPLSASCIWFSDWDEDWLREEVTYDNHTNYYIDCYIDDHYETTVRPYDEATVRDRDWDGRHLFYSRTVDGDVEWGPDYFYLDDGDHLVIDLYDDRWDQGSIPTNGPSLTD